MKIRWTDTTGWEVTFDTDIVSMFRLHNRTLMAVYDHVSTLTRCEFASDDDAQRVRDKIEELWEMDDGEPQATFVVDEFLCETYQD